METKYILKLYITGNTGNSQTATKNLNNILEAKLKRLYTLEIIDVLKKPELAIEDKILATPTLIKVSPEPAKRIIGDLSDKEKVLSGLDLYVQLEDMMPERLQSIHEEACLQTSDALARLIGKQAVVDIASQNVRRVEELVPPLSPAETIARVCLPVNGGTKGIALLLFSRQTAFHLSDLLIGKAPGTTNKLDELDESALKELGNIVCGSYFTTLSNHTGIKMIEHIAQFTFDKIPAILEQTMTKFPQNQDGVLAIETEFNFTIPTLRGLRFRTYFLVLFETAQYEAIIDSLEEAERDFIAEAAAGKI